MQNIQNWVVEKLVEFTCAYFYSQTNMVYKYVKHSSHRAQDWIRPQTTLKDKMRQRIKKTFKIQSTEKDKKKHFYVKTWKQQKIILSYNYKKFFSIMYIKQSWTCCSVLRCRKRLIRLKYKVNNANAKKCKGNKAILMLSNANAKQC